MLPETKALHAKMVKRQQFIEDRLKELDERARVLEDERGELVGDLAVLMLASEITKGGQ